MNHHPYKVLSLFSGAGGFDIGFEQEGFSLVEAVDFEPHCIATLRANRPEWSVVHTDIRKYYPSFETKVDVLLAGFPCQGFSLGGNRQEDDARNTLYREAIRVASALQPRIVVLENVLNLRTMRFPESGRPMAAQISHELSAAGYQVFFESFRVSGYGVPQTRRRFVFVGFLGSAPAGYHLPEPSGTTSIRKFLYKLGQDHSVNLANHSPQWGFKSQVHVETAAPFPSTEEAIPVRFSRTASDGNPIRSFDKPFPAVDTATVWGWALGNVHAIRVIKDRSKEKFIRNPNAKVKLWRISASKLRTFTHREYARLQTFPDDWVFLGNNKRDIQKQIGNAVPVVFAAAIARNVRCALSAMDEAGPFRSSSDSTRQLPLLH